MRKIVSLLFVMTMILSLQGCVNKEKAIDRKVKILEEEAALAIQTKNFNLAEEKLEAVLELRPGSEYVINNLAVICAQYSNKPEKAIKLWSEIIAKNKDNAAYFNNIAGLYWQTGDIDKAIEHYTRAAEIQPKYHMPFFNLAQIYLDEKDWVKAAENAGKSYRLTPKDSRVVLMYTKTEMLIGNRKEALDVLESMYNENPQILMTTIAYIRTLIGENKLEEALTAINKALGESPMNPLLLAELVELNLRKETPVKDIETIITQMQASDAKPFVNMVKTLFDARVEINSGNTNQAVKLLKSLDKQIPGEFQYFEGIRLWELANIAGDDIPVETVEEMKNHAIFLCPERFAESKNMTEETNTEESDEK